MDYEIVVHTMEMGPEWQEAVKRALAKREEELSALDPGIREVIEAVGSKIDAEIERRFLFGDG